LETADLSACIRECDVILLAGLPESTYLLCLGVVHDPTAVVYLLSLILLSLWIVDCIVFVARCGRVHWAPRLTRRHPSTNRIFAAGDIYHRRVNDSEHLRRHCEIDSRSWPVP